MRLILLLIFPFLALSGYAHPREAAIEHAAGGIKGVIKADDGTPLAYATIYVRQTETGVASDLQGRYEVTLPPGTYDVIYQYLGYESVQRKVEVKDTFVVIDITLKTHVVVLQNLTIRAGKEDPAYTIMRKAIAKAKYHTQQLDAYTARVYIKGKGQLKDYPWIAKKALEKEGIDKDRIFIQESVSDIKYTRPNKFEEKVIAIYTTGKSDTKQSPNAYVFGSFYEPEIAETVSPLSPKSFSYYRFEYLGTFKDRGVDVSKIKVTPRSRGDNVVEGTLYIVEDWWAIHSLDFEVTKLGVTANVKQIYNPIEDKAWLPVSQTFKVTGKVFGFEFEGDYLATVKDYKITLNPALPQEMTVIDEKTEKEEVQKKEPPKKAPTQKQIKNQKVEEKLKNGQEVTDKELRQIVKEYEKQELKESKAPDVISESNFSVDSLAYKKDSTFWNEMRPTPLTKEEIKGYEKEDSVNEVERKRNEGDTLRNSSKKNKKGFQPWDVLTGDSYKITETSSFRIHTPFGGFNSVEGINLIYRTSLYKRWVIKDSLNKKTLNTYRLEVSPVVRYAFAREKFSGFLRVDFRSKDYRIWAEAGRYVQQYNADEPIHSFVNSVSTLILGNNWMKLYERDFIDLNYRHRFNDKYTLRSYWTVVERRELFNNTSYTFFKRFKERITPNEPVAVEEPLGTSFVENQAFIGSVALEARPWQKYRIRNGSRQRVNNSTPVFTLEYRKGFSNVFGSDVKFDQIELGVRKQVKLGIRGTLDLYAKGGTFFNNDRMYFMDYKHFLGNRTFFVTTDPTGSFRLLDYYRYSTADEYLEAHAHYHFRKFLLTYLPKARLLGLSENLFVNHLATRTAQYSEIGYSIDGILRLFRIEGAMGFQDLKFGDANFGFRIGIASSITANFND